MKLKKILSLLLGLTVCLININIVEFNSFAEGSENTIVNISAVVNGNSRNLPALKNKDGVIFFSGKTLSDITVYQNNTAPTIFQHDKANDSNKYREILIDKSKKNAQLVSFWSGEPIIKKTISLPDIIEKEGELFFPVAEMLPLLNSNASVEEGKLYIEDVEYSMSNIMPEFNISDYMFNMYDDNDFLGLSDTQILAGYSYLFNGLVDFELKKFVPIIGARAHRIESYEEIFTSYLAEDDAYFAAIGDEEHYDLPMINYLLDDDSERINTVIEGMEAANDIVKDYSGYDISSEDLKMIKSSAALGKQLDYAIKLYSFAAIYTDHVTDHYEMLDAIYGLDFSKIENNRIGITEESYSAAKKVYEMYSDDQKQAIANYIGKQIENKVKDMIEDGIKDGISEELALGHAFAWSKLAASVMKAYFIATDFPVYNVSRKCENLSYYNKLMERGLNQFWAYNNAYDNISRDNIEKSRLSAIFALLSSRSMYQALLDSEKAYGHTGAVYQRKIDSINEALKKMYLAKNCCLTDSEEYIDERIKLLNSSMISVSTPDSNDKKIFDDFDKAIYGAMIKAFNSYNKVYKYRVCDLDNDNQYEMAINIAFNNEDEFRGTSVLAENLTTANLRYHLPEATASAWSSFIYDTKNDRILFSEQKASVGHMYSIYSCYENDKWNVSSKYERKIIDGHDEPQVVSCFWENNDITEEQFRNNENDLNSQWENSDEIFNIEIDYPIEIVFSNFNNYLSNNCQTSILENVTVKGNKKIYIITAKQLFDNYIQDIDYFSNVDGFLVDCPDLRNCLTSAYTTSFILDETENGTRIRCQNFNEELTIKYENNSIISYRNEVPYKISISSGNGRIDNNTITFDKPLNSINKDEAGDLSNIILNINARTRAHDGLVLREGPSVDTKQLDLIPYGTNLRVISLCNGFKYGSGDPMVLTEYNGKRGYVHSRYILIDNNIDISSYSLEQKYAFGVLYYNQAQTITFDFWHNGGIADCTPTQEYEQVSNGNYEKLLPQGVTIAQVTSDFYKYFSTDYSYNDGIVKKCAVGEYPKSEIDRYQAA